MALLFRGASLHPLMMMGVLDVAHVPAACLLSAKGEAVPHAVL